MRSKEFVKEAGRGGSFDDSGMPINQPLDPKEFPPLKIGQVDNSRWGKGRTILSATTSGDGTVWRSADGQIWSVKYGPMPPAQQAQPEVTLPQTQRNLRDPNSLNQQEPAQNAQPEITLPQNQRNLRDPNSLNQNAQPEITIPQTQRNLIDPRTLDQQVPAYVDRIPAVKPVAPAQTDPRVYGPKGEIIRPNALEKPGETPVSDLDRYTRNDLPFVPYTGPEPKPDVKPKPNTTPIPRRKVPKSVVQVSPDKQNLATTKTTLTPDEIKAAQEALRDPTIGPRDKAYYTELLKNQPAHPTNMSYDKNGKALFPMPSPFANRNAQPVPAAAGSVVIKPGDTLSKIAAANGTTVQAIMSANPSIRDQNTIAAGQTVKLRATQPAAASATPATATTKAAPAATAPAAPAATTVDAKNDARDEKNYSKVNSFYATKDYMDDQRAKAAERSAEAKAARAKTPMTAAQVNETVDQRFQQSADAAMARSAASGAPVTGGGPKVDRSTFEESVDQMRRLSNMLKG